MIRILLATVLAGAMALPASAAPADILARLVRSRATSAYRGEQIIATWDGSQTQTTFVRVEYDPPGWTRLEYRPMGSSALHVVLRHDAQEIQYDPLTRRGTRRTRLPDTDDDVEMSHLSWLAANYRVNAAPAELLGRPVARIDIRPLAPDRPSRHIYVDDATGVVLRSERVAPDGRVGEMSTFVAFAPMARGWRLNVRIPSGLRLAAEAQMRPIAPAQAAGLAGQPLARFTPPAGFHLTGVYLARSRPPVIQSVYTDGLSTLVLTQRPGSSARAPRESRLVQTGGGPMWIHSMGLRTLVHWASSGWLLTLVGDLSPDTMIATAQHTGVSPAPRLLDRLLGWMRELYLRLF